MRAIIQRVQSASVAVEGSVTGSIRQGLLVLLGVQTDDTEAELQWISRKIVQIRCFEDEAGKLNRSLLDIQGEILLISQFTLFGSLKKGSRPSFNRAAPPERAEALYELAKLSLATELGREIACGIFGGDMQIQSHLDGPVTLILDTRNKEV